jgi:hypothetical protein
MNCWQKAVAGLKFRRTQCYGLPAPIPLGTVATLINGQIDVDVARQGGVNIIGALWQPGCSPV